MISFANGIVFQIIYTARTTVSIKKRLVDTLITKPDFVSTGVSGKPKGHP